MEAVKWYLIIRKGNIMVKKIADLLSETLQRLEENAEYLDLYGEGYLVTETNNTIGKIVRCLRDNNCHVSRRKVTLRDFNGRKYTGTFTTGVICK